MTNEWFLEILKLKYDPFEKILSVGMGIFCLKMTSYNFDLYSFQVILNPCFFSRTLVRFITDPLARGGQ